MKFPLVALSLALFVSGRDASTSRREKCISSASCWPDDHLFRALDLKLDGDVVLPGDKAWKKSIKLKNPRLSIIPGAVVMVESSDDVVAVVQVSIEGVRAIVCRLQCYMIDMKS